ncbi:4497_t:CDS:2, partial [Racocetra persica]
MSSESNITDVRDLPDFMIIAPSGLISGFINCICLIYLIVRLLIRWWVTKRSLPMVHRVPFYITLSVNMGYTTLNGHPIQGDVCKAVGGIAFFIVSSNVTLVGSLSLMTYLR